VNRHIYLLEPSHASHHTCLVFGIILQVILVVASVFRINVNPQLWEQPVLPYHPTTKYLSIGRSQLHQQLTKSQITRLKHSLKGVLLFRYPTIRAPVPPLPLHHFRTTLSIPMDSGSDGLLMANIRRSTREERTEQSRRMSFMIIV
jgi:hypothetical protein